MELDLTNPDAALWAEHQRLEAQFEESMDQTVEVRDRGIMTMREALTLLEAD